MGIGGALAVVAAIGIAVGLKAGDSGPQQPPPASRAGLVVEMGEIKESSLDPARPLRCFVGGQFVGEATLAQCARKNGVATNALDVGIDETGALAAASETTAMITPLPPAAATPAAPAPAAAAACWSHTPDWRRMPGDMTLNACVQSLFAGRCEKPGAATYGRWGEQTLRLVPGKVEISSDNRSFRTLVEQSPGGCALPQVGG